ncbi:hypothetical protein H5410_038459 [Solanum commersonii]|uniref:Uncharacterized protein n=1 Tax=Solanum commersonii TaxID=4109 RepID=A0A9J5Y909_SOLCO|nr:hypothetical protein H5410_038459 [Solanum commersonii]
MPKTTLEVLNSWPGVGSRGKKEEWWKLIPACIWWSIWKERNAKCFEGQKINFQRIKANSYYNGRSALDELVVTHELVRPMTIRKNGEIIWKANRTVLVSVDHVVGKFKDVGLGNSTNGWCYNPRYIDYYKESLVLPNKWTNYCVGDAYESFTC